jgi:hypothetical protein
MDSTPTTMKEKSKHQETVVFVPLLLEQCDVKSFLLDVQLEGTGIVSTTESEAIKSLFDLLLEKGYIFWNGRETEEQIQEFKKWCHTERDLHDICKEYANFSQDKLWRWTIERAKLS